MIRGSIAALVTPMDASGAVDLTALDCLIDMHLHNSTHGLVAVGTTGESATLNINEHVAVIERVVTRVAGRIPVIAGTGSNCTKEAIELTAAAKQVGADACLIVTPYYVRPTQEGLISHFQMIADSVEIPQILYNVPARTGSDLLNESVAKLSTHPNIIGLKDATGDLQRAKELLNLTGQGFCLYSGDDMTALELLQLGAEGVISVTANLLPRAISVLCEASQQGEVEFCTDLDSILQPLHRALFCEPSPTPTKWALFQRGLIGPGIRLPLLPLSLHEREALMKLINSVEESLNSFSQRLFKVKFS
ncbi:4-hydroxy-tetrahydrodipicolinate synthase [Pseudomonas putida]|uniref:4-hydroxy-tetrahydrodipicolinate synthase n=1 Tax=Pseudomonas putida TaxID=303 RepID=UPI000E074F7A|nr:4-hydroxy-tetrahydrodipicolinate synthase [Pseudomonas putida]SUD79738.1 Dihydrodipicolinate synthase [Pseudomonas putida]